MAVLLDGSAVIFDSDLAILTQKSHADRTPKHFFRYGHGSPDDVAAAARGDGGLSDVVATADSAGAARWIKSQLSSNGKVGIGGFCSGGRLAVLVASSVPDFDAVFDLTGGRAVASPERLNAKMPLAPIDLTPNLTAPIIGFFGNDDRGPTPDEVDQHEAALQAHGKTYMFHRYDGTGHGFFYYDPPSYRQQPAMDAWGKIFDWFGQYLA